MKTPFDKPQVTKNASLALPVGDYIGRWFPKMVLGLFVGLALSACGGGSKKVAAEPVEPGQDITRPPQTIVGREEVKERNPDETISFDEWRKRRLEEQRKQENP